MTRERNQEAIEFVPEEIEIVVKEVEAKAFYSQKMSRSVLESSRKEEFYGRKGI